MIHILLLKETCKKKKTGLKKKQEYKNGHMFSPTVASDSEVPSLSWKNSEMKQRDLRN